MSRPGRPARRRPSRLWLFFYGRRRSGFPGLLVALVGLVLLLALLYALPGGADLSRYWIVITVAALLFLVVAALVVVVVAAFRPPRRRGGPRGRQ